MGYHTNFEISAEPDVIDEDFEKVFLENTGYSLYRGGLEGKWYKHHTDMEKISKLYPDVKFTVNGEGEENGDIWKAYYLNGKSQMCKVKTSFEPRTLW
jgi:hypothetical protein